jgi:AraC-like DNA-binding protein
LDELATYFETEKPYLDPELNLITLSRKLNLSRVELSKAINTGLGKNINDFLNDCCIEAVKAMRNEGKQKQLSLLGIAMECSFDSKATFNRVFKRATGKFLTMYIRNYVGLNLKIISK